MPDGTRTPPKADPNLTICAECGAKLSDAMEYHPHAFCVLVKGGLDPEDVVHDAIRVLTHE